MVFTPALPAIVFAAALPSAFTSPAPASERFAALPSRKL
jgi:hypothetical protein